MTVYRNRDDRTRVVVHRDASRPDMWTYTRHWLGLRNTRHVRADFMHPLPSAEDALDVAMGDWGQLTELDLPDDDPTRGWPVEAPLRPTPDERVAVAAGQVWRMGSRRLVVESVGPDWRGDMQVSCHFTDASGRERGTMVRGRKSATQTYAERRFREKFRYVSGP